jgi:ATP-dependent helicase HrpB
LRRRGREVPEIQRRELSGLVLSLRAMGAGSLEWLDAPPAEAYQAAENLLLRLGATSSGGSITARGRAMAKLPLHPRLAALVCEAERRGAGREGCEAAALLSAGDRLPAGLARHRGQSDVLALMEQTPSQEARRLRDLLLRQVKPGAPQANPDAILISILSAFPDRLVYRRGGIPELFESSVVGGHPLLVAIDIEQRRERGTLVRLASAVQPEWLIDLFPERVEERVGLQWNRAAERVEASSALLYDGLVIEESTGGSIDPGEAAKILAHQAVEAGVERFTDPEELRALAARTEFAAMHGGPPALDNTRIEQALTGLCYGLRSFAELRGAAGDSLLSSLLDSYSPAERRLLEEIAPERYRLPRGRTSRIHYEAVKPPWLATRMQDFFGMKESPRVARGQVALVLHLLAPNQRSVQTTTDLASFWQHLYPELRRQLSRRYPKHQWPENPMD